MNSISKTTDQVVNAYNIEEKDSSRKFSSQELSNQIYKDTQESFVPGIDSAD